MMQQGGNSGVLAGCELAQSSCFGLEGSQSCVQGQTQAAKSHSDQAAVTTARQPSECSSHSAGVRPIAEGAWLALSLATAGLCCGAGVKAGCRAVTPHFLLFSLAAKP